MAELDDQTVKALLAQLATSKKKKRFNQRITTAIPTGFGLGFVFWLLAYFLTTAINTTAGTQQVNALGLSLGAFGLGLTLPIAHSFAKDEDDE